MVLHPSTESAPHAFAIVAKGGRGYTWLADSEAQQKEWFDAIRDAIDDCRAGGARRGLGASRMASQILSLVERKTPEARVQAISIGSCLTKYNVRDGKTSLRWVKLHGNKVVWGDARSRKCDESKGQSLGHATAHPRRLLVVAARAPRATTAGGATDRLQGAHRNLAADSAACRRLGLALASLIGSR